ncbi:Nudix family hydrolase [Neptunomonas japonica]|uniref:8-oxo-dGTP diphosphatase n=1 Tax=Neptunomonas japonica JAMM 1380 TaxID=1441457 RepID=A0A7R6PR84_9GAMM|nr:Nudix family hydrolase [Neptunomonas japonica]BBB28925.1 7,8-dihydro-8-oxoguanine triphosphatase [Neptunomonas japonica JAMM 1380]
MIHVAAAVIDDGAGNIFLAKRPDDKHQGGLWEFPGGKVEPGESSEVALARELDEEIGIKVNQVESLIQIPYHYSDKSVFLDVFRVTGFSGEAWGREGQEVRWVPLNELDSYPFPAANKPILNAVLLPDKLLITKAYSSVSGCISGTESAINAFSLTWFMLRQKQLSEEGYAHWVRTMRAASQLNNRRLILSCSVELANSLKGEALHLTSQRLMAMSNREEFSGRFLGASCHSLEELNKAQLMQCDYVTLSPISPTKSHPSTPVLGWKAASNIIAQAALPVFLLGGMNQSDLMQAKSIGAQGIAGINAWCS